MFHYRLPTLYTKLFDELSLITFLEAEINNNGLAKRSRDSTFDVGQVVLEF
jgi:hypothetical protein